MNKFNVQLATRIYSYGNHAAISINDHEVTYNDLHSSALQVASVISAHKNEQEIRLVPELCG